MINVQLNNLTTWQGAAKRAKSLVRARPACCRPGMKKMWLDPAVCWLYSKCIMPNFHEQRQREEIQYIAYGLQRWGSGRGAEWLQRWKAHMFVTIQRRQPIREPSLWRTSAWSELFFPTTRVTHEWTHHPPLAARIREQQPATPKICSSLLVKIER